KDSMISYYLALEKGARQVCVKEKIQLLYIRRIFCTPFHLKTLRLLKNQGVHLVEELPTYPYDGENKNYTQLSYKITAVIDKICRGQYKKYLDFFTLYNGYDEVFGVPALRLENGIDFANIRFVPTEFPKDRIDLIAVSAMAPWHGYERVLEGMNEYYKAGKEGKRRVNFHIVGQGQEKENWQEMARQFNLEEQVKFYGQLTGDALSEVFDRCQIGIASLGCYKKNMFDGSELKIHEYMAYGKPFIYTLDSSCLTQEMAYCKKVANDETPLDIEAVVKFYDEVRKREEVSQEMNRFARENYSWQVQMKKVMDEVAGKMGR
ncbi:MAG: glycosyltransferase, partial [Oscillospiraceae bacterium]